ncbi:hypothetical protein NIES22_60500 [Calothrix brevissima NIES-22]|nr:hypothetical protein NIES22_60500 [Calothrix brevissima NIES-22]
MFAAHQYNLEGMAVPVPLPFIAFFFQIGMIKTIIKFRNPTFQISRVSEKSELTDA